MSVLAPERGSAATWLQEQPVAPHPAFRTDASPDAHPIADITAIADPDHVTRKQSITMSTTTESPPKETITTGLKQPPTTQAVAPPTRRSARLAWSGRAKTILHWVVDVWSHPPAEDRLDMSAHRQHELMLLWRQTR